MKKLSDAEKWTLLAGTNASKAANELCDKPREETHKLSNEIGVAYMVEVVGQLSSDAAADLLRNLPQDFSAEIVNALSKDKAAHISEILSHAKDTAGALMAKEFLHIPEEMTVVDAIEFLHLIPSDRKGKIPYIYVLDREKKLVGVLQTRHLIFNALEKPIREIMKSPVISVGAGAPADEAAKILQNYRLLAVPVTDGDGRLAGIISADNVLQMMKEQADKDIAKMIGTDAEEMKTHSIPKIMRLRLPWLLVSVASGLFCAFITGTFHHNNAETVAMLFFFVPVVLGLSESTGIQGATIVVRNMTLGKSFSSKEIAALFFREVAVGVLIGLICGLIVGVVTSVWQGSAVIGLAVSLSMNVAIIISALIGLSLPLLFKRFNVDPAMASGPLVLAICDLQTLFVYFTLATSIVLAAK